ncbi:FecR domain-containing protein [Olivibacter sp. SDN3]|uniref:FecR family protein n=1 Tax=Olivibacter sp. SDN3 TaxID=2764720 RepID=UPI001651619B|nr:FecR family protein [Olivibacter sp. SDN3]QNL49369.1 FecR domain-containing protein [Olivibacter sp. SDN3]
MNRKEIDQFLTKVAANEHSDKDLERFRKWLSYTPKPEANDALNRYIEVVQLTETVDTDRLSRISQEIEQKLDWKQKNAARHLPLFIKIAASVLLIISGYYIFQNQSINTQNTQSHLSIHPGKEQATLILADGSKIDLNKAADGTIQGSTKEGITGFSKKAGLLSYEVSRQSSEKRQVHTLAVPRGGQYKLLLPDGTKIWLNAASTLSFPTSFAADKREVFLDGEAYLEVAQHPTAPFTVKTTKGEVNVLGTHFNIRAYGSEEKATTTLLEGSVKVSNKYQSALLKPGDQATHKEKEDIILQQVETTYATAWKNGYFMFNQQPITEVMEQIALWYDIEVFYRGEKPVNKIWGTTSRSDSFNDVLKTLQALGSVQFKIEGRKVYVEKTNFK